MMMETTVIGGKSEVFEEKADKFFRTIKLKFIGGVRSRLFNFYDGDSQIFLIIDNCLLIFLISDVLLRRKGIRSSMDIGGCRISSFASGLF